MNYKVNKIMPVESGVSQTTGNKWVSQTIVVEQNTPDVQYPNKYVLQLMNDKVNMAQSLREGDIVEVGFYSTVREFQTKAGKQMFAQENRCWKILKVEYLILKDYEECFYSDNEDGQSDYLSREWRSDNYSCSV